MVSAPFASVLLADLGADVIKVEHPTLGDTQRKLEPIVDGVSLWWKAISRNKRCVTLDLSKAAGAAVFKDLIRGRDVVVENYRPGTLERWGIGFDVLRAIEPKLIMLRITGFGQTGPYRDRPGFGRVAEAMSGLINLIGEPDGPPMVRRLSAWRSGFGVIWGFFRYGQPLQARRSQGFRAGHRLGDV